MTNIIVTGNNIAITYDHKDGELVGSFELDPQGQVLRGKWGQGADDGDFELTFNSDFTIAKGWWNHGGDTTRSEHSLVVAQKK